MAHSQLHEVLFAFLPTRDVLAYRQIHSKCDEIVACLAETQIQDAVGQDLSEMALQGADSEFTPRRQLDARLLKMLVIRGDDISNILSRSPGGVRSLSTKLLRGAFNDNLMKVFSALCGAVTEETARTIVHVDVSNDDNGDVSDTFIHLVATHSTHLRCLDSSGFRRQKFRRDDVLTLIAANCRQLQHLNLGGLNGEITDEGMKLIAVNCYQMRYLNTNKASRISDKSMKVVATNCLKLQVVDVSDTVDISDESMKLLAMNCRELQSLNLSVRNPEMITDETIMQVASNCRQLRSLTLSGLWITDESIKLIATNCRHLQLLDVSHTSYVTDQSIEAVGTHCDKLQSLDVSGTVGRITDASITLVASKCRHLISLKAVGHASKITSASLALLPQSCAVLHYPRTK